MINNFLSETSPRDKIVVLSFDSMYLREHIEYSRYTDRVLGLETIDENATTNRIAQNFLVFMIRSIFGGWTQIIGHHFTRSALSKDELKTVLLSYLHALHNASIKIKAIVCDQEPSHVSMFKSLDVCPSNPFIHCPSCDENFFIIFYPPHLLKSTRYNLITNDFVVSE